MGIKAKQDWQDIIHRCFRCGYCKFTHEFENLNCPSYKKHRFETYSTGGRLWLIYGALNGEIPWSEDLANVLYSCSTCGNCTENCRFDKFNDFLVDFIEAARFEAVKNGFCPEKQQFLLERINNPEFYNPYAETNSTNHDLISEYNLPENAEWVYFIGCTSNYRQTKLRDATLRFLKKAGINFTLIDEHCCCSPLIRTGQLDPIKDNMNHNLIQIKNKGATRIITSCAGCYRTLKKDWAKYQDDLGLEIYHTIELVKKLMEENRINFNSELNQKVTYHDPCHLGRHMEIYDTPREVLKRIPGVELVEMDRNRSNAWCCGAGGGVKLGYPEWAVEISTERIKEAKQTDAAILSSACPFCKRNLSDANSIEQSELQILDIIEILDRLEFTVK